ncbi:MAG: hypothetical protein D6729_03235 [Deltaproteobacteria bacterium]|nr:MAG: hypothetical protein D6729_03235 [Deltaproteobacteria bacterium]
MTDSKERGKFEGERVRKDLERLWQSALDGLEDLKEIMVRASTTAKVKLDATFLRRERDRLFQELGEEAYLLIEEGKLEVPPALRDTVDRIHAIVEQLAEEEAALRGEGPGEGEDVDPAADDAPDEAEEASNEAEDESGSGEGA